MRARTPFAGVLQLKNVGLVLSHIDPSGAITGTPLASQTQVKRLLDRLQAPPDPAAMPTGASLAWSAVLIEAGLIVLVLALPGGHPAVAAGA